MPKFIDATTRKRSAARASALEIKRLKAEARRMRRDGKTLSEIGKALGRHDAQICEWCKGIKTPKSLKQAEKRRLARKMRRQGELLKPIAKRLGVVPQTVFTWTRDIPVARKESRYANPELRSTAYHKRKHRATLAEIADEFGLCPSGICRMLQKMQEKLISDEIYYFYNRDENGECYEVERHKVIPDGEIEIERVPLRT